MLCAVCILALRGVQNQGLLHLSQSANKCKAVLQEHLQLARRVVHLNELSRRLETVQEQVVKEEVSMMSDVEMHNLITRRFMLDVASRVCSGVT